MRPLLSFVIPCYNSEFTLRDVVGEIRTTVEADGRYDYEVILVNDNAPDKTWQLIESLAAENPHVRGMSMIRNFGQHSALMAGLGDVKGDIIVCLDDDGQTPPCEVFKLVDALSDSIDVAYADYPEHKHASIGRKLGSKLNNQMAHWLIQRPKDVYLSSYIAAKRIVIDEVLNYKGPYPYVDGLILRSAGGIASIPVEHRDREVGKSGYSLHKLMSLWLNGFTSFSVKPLRVSTATGGALATIGVITAIVIFIRKLVFGAAIDAGWTSIVCLLLIIGGMLMAMVGLVGEYIGRIYISMNGAPQYIVKETCGDKDIAQEAEVETPAADSLAAEATSDATDTSSDAV